MRNFIATCSLVLFTVCTTAVAETKHYIVGVEEFDYYPLYAFGKRDSLSEDLLNAFATDAGLTFEYKPLGINRLYHELLVDGSIDFKYPDNAYWGGDKKKGSTVLYSSPAVPYTDGVLVPKANKGNNLSSLTRLGMPTGFTPQSYGDLEKSGALKLKRHYEIERLVKDVMLGKTQGLYSNVTVAQHLVDKDYGSSLTYDPGLPHSDSHYHLSTIKHGNIIKQFDDFLKRNPDLITTLKEKYN